MHQITHNPLLKAVTGGANSGAANMPSKSTAAPAPANPCPAGLVPTGATVNISQATVSGTAGITGSLATKDISINASVTLNNAPNTTTVTCGLPSVAPAASTPSDGGGGPSKKSRGEETQQVSH